MADWDAWSFLGQRAVDTLDDRVVKTRDLRRGPLHRP